MLARMSRRRLAPHLRNRGRRTRIFEAVTSILGKPWTLRRTEHWANVRSETGRSRSLWAIEGQIVCASVFEFVPHFVARIVAGILLIETHNLHDGLGVLLHLLL